MVKTKSLEATTAKWQAKVANASQDYADGVANPRRDWEAATKEAAPIYKEAVIKAANEGRFEKGVSGKGQKWAANAATKGVERWPGGVAQAGPEYANGMGKVLAAINSTVLPARRPAGDPANLQRVAAVNKKVHDACKGK